MAAIPSYAGTPRLGVGALSAANANRDGTGTIVPVLTAGIAGSRIDAIGLKATATTTSGMIRLFLSDGVTTWLLTEVPVIPTTPSATTPAWEAQLTTSNMSQVLPLILPTGCSLSAATEKAEAFNVTALGGDF